MARKRETGGHGLSRPADHQEWKKERNRRFKEGRAGRAGRSAMTTAPPAEVTPEISDRPQLHIIECEHFTATVDAYALEHGTDQPRTPWFISIIGTQSAVKAISANITKLKPAHFSLTPYREDEEPGAWNAAGIVCHRNHISGSWRQRRRQLPLSKAWHGMAYSTMAEYAHNGPEFLILGRENEEREAMSHLHFVAKRVAIPLHPSWAPWLWHRAIAAGEAEKLDCNGMTAWKCCPNEMMMRLDISEAVADGALTV